MEQILHKFRNQWLSLNIFKLNFNNNNKLINNNWIG